MNREPGIDRAGIAAGHVKQLGVWSGWLTTLFAAAAFALGITTPPRSGPFCAGSCIQYPYTDAAAFVPRDYLWMYPGFLLTLSFVVLLVCIHRCAPDGRKEFSLIGLCFALICGTLIASDYFIQIQVMQPSLFRGETAGLSLFSQYNPHGIFIALEDLGYLMMSLAMLFAAFVFIEPRGLPRAIRVLFVIDGVATVAALVMLSLNYGLNLEYRFEVASLSINWIVLMIAGVMLAKLFQRVQAPTER